MSPLRQCLSKPADALLARARSIIFPDGGDSMQNRGMLRHERWLAFDAEGKPAEPSLRSALVETFEHFERTRPPPSAASLRSTVVLDDGTGQPWTIRIDRGNFTLTPGQARDADAIVSSDPLTLASIVRGKRSGIEPYLRGRLRVRGNLSLALKL